MTRIIAFANQKGGVAKTTTTINVGASLALQGKKVLLIDLDQQGSLTAGLGFRQELESSVYNLFEDAIAGKDIKLEKYLLNYKNKFDVIGADISLAEMETKLYTIMGREKKLKQALSGKISSYDYVLIDCPPSLGILLQNAFCFAGEVIVPTQAQFFSIKGLVSLVKTIIDIKREEINKDLKITGAVITSLENTKIQKDGIEKINSLFKNNVFKTKIRKNVEAQETQLQGITLVEYNVSSKIGKDYMDLTNEIINKQS